MARKIASTRFIIDTSDLASAIHRMKLDIPQSPFFSALPIGVDALSPNWMNGRKIKPELMATVQALTSPARVLHLVRQARYGEAPLETRLFSRTGTAPYIMAASEDHDHWDIAVMSSKLEVVNLLEGLCGFAILVPTSDADHSESLTLTTEMIGTLALIADRGRYVRAKALASFEPLEVSPWLGSQSTLDLSDLQESMHSAGNSGWSSVLVNHAIGGVLLHKRAKTDMQDRLDKLAEAGRLTDAYTLTPRSAALVSLLDEARSITTIASYSRSGNDQLQMSSFLPVSVGCLIFQWAVDEHAETVTVTAVSKNAASHMLGKML